MIEDFQFTEEIGGNKLLVDVGFGSNNFGIEVMVDLWPIHILFLEFIRSCDDGGKEWKDQKGPFLHVYAKAGEEWFVKAEGGMYGCLMGICACIGGKVEFTKEQLTGCATVELAGFTIFDDCFEISFGGGRRNLNYDEEFILFPSD